MSTKQEILNDCKEMKSMADDLRDLAESIESGVDSLITESYDQGYEQGKEDHQGEE